jgi:hypothetical protein
MNACSGDEVVHVHSNVHFGVYGDGVRKNPVGKGLWLLWGKGVTGGGLPRLRELELG